MTVNRKRCINRLSVLDKWFLLQKDRRGFDDAAVAKAEQRRRESIPSSPLIGGFSPVASPNALGQSIDVRPGVAQEQWLVANWVYFVSPASRFVD